MTENGQSSIVTKCTNMVDILAISQRPLSFSELSVQSGLVKSSTHRILAILLNERLASFDETTKKYSLGSRSLTWARAYLKRSNLPNIAESHLEELCRNTDMHGALSIRDQNAILYLKTYNPVPVKFASLAGEHAPLHCTASGKVLLAFLPDERRQNVLQSLSYEPYTQFTIRDAETMDTELEKIRQQGYGFALQEEVFQVVGVAAPIRDSGDNVIAAISLWSLTERTSRDEIGKYSEAVRTVADEISTRYASGSS